MKRSAVTAFAFSCGTLLSGCVTPDPQSAFTRVQSNLDERTAAKVTWSRSAREDTQSTAMVTHLLAGDLTAESGVQIALLQNHGLQATFEDLGIAYADLIQAGRLTNPGFSGGVAFSDAAGAKSRINLSVTQNFLDALALPLRRRVASQELEQTQARVADAVLRLAAEVKSAVYALQAQSQVLGLLELGAEADERMVDLARMQHDAGNISDLEFFSRRAAAAETRQALAQARAQFRAGREQLNRLLGLDTPHIDWKLAPLPPLPTNALPADLEARAIQQRFDLQVARTRCASLALALGLTRKYRLLGGLEFAVEAERDTDGEKLIGPAISVELPLFDQGQSRVARTEALLRQAEKELAEKTINVRSEVREAQDRMTSAYDVAVEYRDELVPEQEQIVKEAMLHYNGMLLGAYQLLETRQQALRVDRAALEATREYWQAHAEIEQAVGGNLSGPPAASGENTVTLSVREPPDAASTSDHLKHEAGGKP